MALKTNQVAVQMVGLEALRLAIKATGDETWLKPVQQDWLSIASPKIEALTPRRSGRLAAATEGKVKSRTTRGVKSRYPAVVEQRVFYGRFVEQGTKWSSNTKQRGAAGRSGQQHIKPRRYMLNTARNLMGYYTVHLKMGMEKHLKLIGLK